MLPMSEKNVSHLHSRLYSEVVDEYFIFTGYELVEHYIP